MYTRVLSALGGLSSFGVSFIGNLTVMVPRVTVMDSTGVDSVLAKTCWILGADTYKKNCPYDRQYVGL